VAECRFGYESLKKICDCKKRANGFARIKNRSGRSFDLKENSKEAKKCHGWRYFLRWRFAVFSPQRRSRKLPRD
jgi:hypothetical protein